MAGVTERQLVILRKLRELTEPAPRWQDSETGYTVPQDAVEAYKIGSPLGLGAMGVSNTLVALQRRGLVAGDGGGTFVAGRWWITPKGAEAADG